MHISTHLLIVANHINVLQMTCIEEVHGHSLAHDVYADKHNNIISAVIIWDVVTTVFYKVTLCIDVTTSGLHLSLIFNVSVTPTYSARVRVRVVTVYDVHFLSTRECRMETRNIMNCQILVMTDDSES